MTFKGVPLLGIAAAALAAAAILSCSGSSGDDLPPLPTATPSVPGGATVPATSPTPSPTPTPDPDVERQRVIDAASEALGGARHVSPLTLDGCLEANPDRNPCFELKSAPEQVVQGLAWLTLGDPDGGASTFLMGRMPDGAWAYWRGSQQQTYLLDALPGDLLACGTDTTATVRSGPSTDAPSVATLDDLTELQADEFVLTEPGQYGVQGERGQGWYHVTDPAGWIDATHTTDAHLADCLLHDAIEQVDRG